MRSLRERRLRMTVEARKEEGHGVPYLIIRSHKDYVLTYSLPYSLLDRTTTDIFVRASLWSGVTMS